MFKWFLTSNRYLHFIGGFILGFLAFNIYYGIYVALVAASCLEFKDRYYNKWDWIDWIITVLGGALGGVISSYIIL